MSPSGKLSVGIGKIRLREKWNMEKIEDQKIGPVDTGWSLRKSMETKSKMVAVAAIMDEWRS
jgi:hypothetical protein